MESAASQRAKHRVEQWRDDRLVGADRENQDRAHDTHGQLTVNALRRNTVRYSRSTSAN